MCEERAIQQAIAYIDDLKTSTIHGRPSSQARWHAAKTVFVILHPELKKELD